MSINNFFYRNSGKFEKEMMDIGRFPNIAAGFVLLMYFFYFSGIPFSNPTIYDVLLFFGISAFIIIFFQFFVAPHTNHMIVKNISIQLEEMKDFIFPESEELHEDINENRKQQRSILIVKLLKLPSLITLQVCTVFALAFGIVLLTLIFFYNLNTSAIIFTCTGFIFGNYFTGLLAFTYSEELCHKYSEKLVVLGINETIIHTKKHFSLGLKYRIILFIIIPLIGSYVIDYMFLKYNLIQQINTKLLIFNTIFLITFNTIITVTLAFLVYHQLTNTNHKINKSLESFLLGNGDDKILLPVNLATEMSYNVFLVNNIIQEMQRTITESQRIGFNIDNETQDLGKMAEGIVKTAENLSAITDKTNKSMQSNVKRQIDIISKHTNDVSHIANVTKNNVNEGFKILNEDIMKYEEINLANIETITHIKHLSEMIERVWESIKKIDKLASKTKIIAFNAELEATAAGGNGENFHIVANEIRRLADSISTSTSDIREKIKSIQDASDNLIVTSEAGTQKIREGSVFFSTLENKFKELKLKSEITAEYANEIQSIISSQDASFVQISTTLTQINTGFQEFSETTKTLTESSENLKKVVYNLGNFSEINDFNKKKKS